MSNNYGYYSVFQSAEVQKLWVLGKRQEAKVKREEKYVYLTSLGNAIYQNQHELELLTRKAIALMTLKEIPVLRFNQEDDSDRTTFFGITLTAAINVHGAFPKSDLWISRTCIRERTLRR
ncbi:hypothetical protein NIES3807_03020 [Microcystis aeruginosa NIES-3807]|uniref:Programmed cell death toxin YdcE n=2 Tax=Microcystis aeruginosa TaxID=1126 RepID=A0AAD3AWP2_MICAE|nr:hypothetical protein NIES3807_03020 [Microcystis aeruginosa NIES-3807]